MHFRMTLKVYLRPAMDEVLVDKLVAQAWHLRSLAQIAKEAPNVYNVNGQTIRPYISKSLMSHHPWVETNGS